MLSEVKNYKISLYVLFVAAILFNISILPQTKNQPTNWPEPAFEHLTMADGLPENSVRCMLQDHLGYLWLGTQNGLVRYDGYNMKVYQPDLNDSLSISDRQIQSIYEDKSKTLWVGTQHGGLNRFDRRTETFKSYNYNSGNTDNNCINEDKNGNLLVGTSDEGLKLFDKGSENFRHVKYESTVYTQDTYEYLLSLINKGKRISSILKVGSNADLTKSFTLSKKTIVLTVIMYEEGYDSGWLESERGEIIIGGKGNNPVYAGGHTHNQIQIVIDTLYRGNYRLRYISDGGWSYNSWRFYPDYPEFWGIQVIALEENLQNINAMLETEIVEQQKYSVLDIIEDKLTGNIFVGVDNKVLVYDDENGCLKKRKNSQLLESSLGEINSFYQSTDGTIWIGHSMGISKLNSVNNSVKIYQPISSVLYNPGNSFWKLIEDNNGLIWGAEGSDYKSILNGLICFNKQSKRFKTYRHNPDKQESLSRNIVESVYQDRSGIMWVGTMWAGLNKWDRNRYKFKRFSFEPNNPVDGKFNRVYSIVEDSEGIIWFGTDNGLYSYNRFSNEFKNHKYNSRGESNRVRHIYIDEYGIIWLGTLTKGLGKFNPVSGLFQFYSNDINDAKSISDNRVTFILPDKNDALWIGTWGGGLNKFNKKTGKFSQYKHDLNNPQSLSHNEVGRIYKDRNGRLWIATDEGGLNLFNQTDKFFESFNFEGDPTTSINEIYEDSKGNFWIGTYQTGVYLFNREKGVPVYNITEKDGFSNNQIKSILEDNSGNLWIGTGNGLSRFDPDTRIIKNYFSSENFDGNRFFDNSAFKTSTGEMLFGTYDGFIMFHPDSIKDDPVPPQVVISNVSLFNRPGEKLFCAEFISELDELKLKYNENDLRFDYVGLHFADPSKNKYKYKLEGFDKDWIDAGTQRNATYTNLDAGEYIFRVKACNLDGVWNEEGASLRIIIPPPFWATWWAYSLYILFGLVALYSIRRYELNRTQLKNQVKLDDVKLKEREEIDKMKSRFFANISHEFRTPLTLIKGPAEKINRNSSGDEIEKQTGVIKRNTDRLLSLINQLLDLSKLEAGKLELKALKQNLVPFIKGITMSFESIAEGKDITLKVIPEKEYIELYFDKEMMTKIMTNLLSNAFKFTPEDGAVTVTIKPSSFPPLSKGELQGGSVEIKVRDTGVGISEEELPKLFDRFYQVDSSQTREYEGTGIGLALTKELVELHQGTITVNSNVNEGTEFTVELPLGRKHLRDYEIVKEPVILSHLSTEDLAKVEAKNLTEPVTDDFMRTDSSSPAPQNDNAIVEDKYIVLVVEDNTDVREYIKDSLGKEFQIEEAQNGEQGVRKAENIIPDLIISDVMMPKMDGNKLTRILKNDEKTSHIPIILLTAKSEQESKLEGLETGADDYLTKPFDTKELQIRINNLINTRRKLQEKFSRVDFVPVKSKKETEKKLSNLEEKFISKVMEVIDNHISEEEFSIEQFGKEVGMSRVQLHRKLKALSGKSASNYLRSVRLSKAKKMIEEEKGNISEIAYSVGFSSPQYFTRCFKEEFGIPPSELSI